MACTSPLKAFYSIGNDGKKQISFYRPEKFNFVPYEDLPDDNKIPIPCGQCVSCRLHYAKNWAVRCVLEAMQYEHNYFVTLTYDEEHLPVSEKSWIDEDTGEYFEGIYSASLEKSVLQKFLKDLRRYYDYHFNFQGIRFFACGEYGPKSMRPHYHLILFNCPIPDLKYEISNSMGNRYYSSEIFNSVWHNQGFVTIGECNFSTCSYVARYMLKKQKGVEATKNYGRLGLVPPFTLCSRDPGIARSYYDSNSNKIYEYDSLIITNSKGVATKVKPPSYFDRLYDIESPEDMIRIKDNRKTSACMSMQSKLENTDLFEEEYLSVVDFNMQEKAKLLLRSL